MPAAILLDCSQGKEPAPTRGKAEAGEGSDDAGVDGTIPEPADRKTVPRGTFARSTAREHRPAMAVGRPDRAGRSAGATQPSGPFTR
jgi:hypothetical protein